MLPPAVLFTLDNWSGKLSFTDVYEVMPLTLRKRMKEPREFNEEKWKEFFLKPLLDTQTYETFFTALGYPLADIATPVSRYKGKVLLLVSPYGKEKVHAKNVYLTMREIEAMYRPVPLVSDKEDNYVNHILGFYKGISLPCSEGESGSSNRYVLADEDNIESIDGLLETISTFGRRFVGDDFVQCMIRVTEGIKGDLEKVKLPR